MCTFAFAGPAGSLYELVDTRLPYRGTGAGVAPAHGEWLIRTCLRDFANARVVVAIRESLALQVWDSGVDDLGALVDAIADEVATPSGRFAVHRLARPQLALDPLPAAVALRDLLEPEAPPPSRPEAPASSPVWIEFTVVHESGVGFPGAEFVLVHPDGSSRRERLDGASHWRGDGIPAGTSCSITFDPPLTLGSVAERVPIGDVVRAPGDRVLVSYGTQPASVPTEAATRLLVPLPALPVVQMREIHFGLERAVVLPRPPQPPDAEHPEDTSALTAIATAIGFATTAEPRRYALIAGHTDTSGSAGGNVTLSEARATNAQLLMIGDGPAWAEHCQGHYAVDDVQRILLWAGQRGGWPCDPGPIDNELGAQTEGALRRFRESFNHERAGSLALDGAIGIADWEAFFAIYEDEMGELLAELGSLGTLREHVAPTDPAVLGCGESWPVESVAVDGYASAANRRVDILFFEESELPDLAAEPAGQDVYGTGRYRAEPVPVRPWTAEGSIDFEVWVALFDMSLQHALASSEYELFGPLPTDVYRRSGTTDGDGRLREDELPAGDYAVEIEGLAVIVGARYMPIPYLGEPDVHAVPGLRDDVLPDPPRVYDDGWVISAVTDEDFADVRHICDPYGDDRPPAEDQP